MKTRFLLPLILGGAALASAQTPSPAPVADDKVKLEEFTVTGNPLSRAIDEIAQPASVLGGRRLDLARQPTLGETLASEPGVSSTYFGPGASRPLIRGLGGDRVRVLSSGVGTIDASVASPDHAVSLDPLLVDRIELVRGPASLLYGGSAIGGAVNVVDSRIPEVQPERVLQGRVEARYGSAADERSGAAVVEGGAGGFAWHLDGFKRRTDDVGIPGFGPTPERRAELEAEGEPVSHGRLLNSATDTDGAAFGLTRFLGQNGAAGHVGFAYSGFDSRYGTVAEPDVTIALRQRRWDFHAESLAPVGWLRAARFQLGVADYRHDELEGADLGTRFTNRGYEGRLELLHEKAGPFEGAVGLQASRSDFAALGDEAFLPPSVTTNRALFLYEEIPGAVVSWQFGARGERQEIEPRGAGISSRSHTAASFSGGFVWKLPQEFSLAVSVARGERAPNAQELYADGPHVGTGVFEIGDPGLAAERVTGVDVTLRKRAGAFSGALTVFANRFDGFIFEHATGVADADSGLEIYRFTQGDARFRGAELELAFKLYEAKENSATLRVTADTVRADDLSTDTPLPRIPPTRFGWGIDCRHGEWVFSVGMKAAAEQDRVAANETPTEAYHLFDAAVTWHTKLAGNDAEFFLRGTNLADETARVHTSFLKDIAPLPGRDIAAGVRFAF